MMVKTVRKQAYILKLPLNWGINLVFQVYFLKKDVMRKLSINQKIVKLFEFEQKDSLEPKDSFIFDNLVLAK